MALQSRPMYSTIFLLTILLNLLITVQDVVGQGQLAEINNRDPRRYTHYEVLDPERKYVLEWVVNWDQRRILFNVTVEARGYVGFGLSVKGELDGADIVIGGVDRFGQTYFTDRHRVGDEESRIDQSQDWRLHSAIDTPTHTSLSFSRAFDTCDENDYPINERDTITLVWAYSDIDSTSILPFGNRGTYQVYLLQPNVVPTDIKMDSFIPGPLSQAREDLRLWTITNKFRMPAEDTTYQCTIHKSPRLERKHHIIGAEVRLESPEALKHVHHILFFRCNPPQNTTSFAFFERYVNHPGQQCYFLAGPLGDIPTQYCTTLKHVFGIGGRIMFYPDHYGMPLGETGPDEYFIMQTHYNNPERLNNVNLEVNMDFYYSSRLRANDGGLMTIGHHTPGSPSILLPPKTKAHEIYGHCSADCTSAMLPPEGIFMSMLVLHTHNSGVQVKARHIRGNVELPWIGNDENYSNTYQAYRLLNREVNIRPGDQVTVVCEYDNTWTNGSVVGGFSSRQEMCSMFAFYYNVVPYAICRSHLVNPDYMEYYLGVTNITWDYPQLDYVATSPRSLAGMSMATISDTQVEWTPELRSELQEDHRHLPQTAVCPMSGSQGRVQVRPGAGSSEESNMLTIPDVEREYAPLPRECSVRGRSQNSPSPQPNWRSQNNDWSVGRRHEATAGYNGRNKDHFNPFRGSSWSIWG